MTKKLQALSTLAYKAVDTGDTVRLIALVREGLSSEFFTHSLLDQFSFSLSEWARYLHLSERTLQRYRTENKIFEPVQSEKILELLMLFRNGIFVFGDKQNFETWMSSKSIALGGIQPKQLLDTSYGINLLKDELTRIEHGVLA